VAAVIDDLIAFLRVRYDEDEQIARDCAVRSPGPWVGMFKQVTSEPDDGQVINVASTERRAVSHHIANWDPGRALAEVEAKRRMLDFLVKLDDIATDSDLWNLDTEKPFKLMALPYAGHPDYRPEWRPAE
jgi:hypothetical protein